MKKTYQILKGARELIKNGWTQGQYRTNSLNKEGHFDYCSVGAIRASNEKLGFSWLDQEKADELLEKLSGGNIVAFNDDVNTKKEDILNLFSKAMRKAR